MGRKHLKYIGLAVVFAFFCGGLARCAKIVAPQGGPRDSIPPRVVAMIPPFGTVNFKGKRVYIEFDEYVQLKEQQKEFFTSPFMKQRPTLTLRGRGIQIDIRDTLLADQTYALNFGRAVGDNNEGNPYTGLRYVFSTGDHIDSLLMSGYTVDALTADTLGNCFILFFDPAADSIPDRDSTLFKSTPLAVGRSFPNGIFLAENLKPMDYRVFALEDKNANQKYDPGIDRVALLDSVYNPLTMPPFDVWYDTTRFSLQADPQVLLRLFSESPDRRQTFATPKRAGANKIEFNFTAPRPRIDELTFEGVDPSRIVTEYVTANRDSMFLWIDTAGIALPDTLRGRLIYRKQDSIMQYFADTVALKLGWSEPERRGRDAEKEENDTVEKPSTFRVTVTPADKVIPGQDIGFSFAYPLVRLDTAAFVLERLQGEGEAATSTRIPYTFIQDTFQIKEWTLKAAWKPEERFRLTIPEGTFRNVIGEVNDTLRSEFAIDSPDQFGTLILDIRGKTPESQYIVQVVDQQGETIAERSGLTTGKHTLQYIPAGEVRLRVVEDENGNGRWDSGSVIRRRKPERVEFFTTEDGGEIITAKANWEIGFEIDMTVLFAPVTMERMQRMIGAREKVRHEKLAKEREEWLKRQQQQNDNHGGQGGIGGIGGAGGFGF